MNKNNFSKFFKKPIVNHTCPYCLNNNLLNIILWPKPKSITKHTCSHCNKHYELFWSK
jgi:hypothetical protein